MTRNLVTELWRYTLLLLLSINANFDFSRFMFLPFSSARVRPIPVSSIGRYSPVSVSADTYLSIGADTSSPVIHLPVSTVNTVARTPTPYQKIMHVVVFLRVFLLIMSPRVYCIWHTVCTFQNIMALYFETYVRYAQRM